MNEINYFAELCSNLDCRKNADALYDFNYPIVRDWCCLCGWNLRRRRIVSFLHCLN